MVIRKATRTIHGRFSIIVEANCEPGIELRVAEELLGVEVIVRVDEGVKDGFGVITGMVPENEGTLRVYEVDGACGFRALRIGR
jgi:hypothetical protein